MPHAADPEIPTRVIESKGLTIVDDFSTEAPRMCFMVRLSPIQSPGFPNSELLNLLFSAHLSSEKVVIEEYFVV